MKFEPYTHRLNASNAVRSLQRVGWLTLAALGGIASTTVTANSAPALPLDEPPCYLRTQDGRIVDLQSLCSRSTTEPATPSPTQQPNAVPQRTSTPQAAPTQISLPRRAPNAAGSHSRGNPDSDDGRY